MLVAADRVTMSDQTSLQQMDRLDSFSWTPRTFSKNNFMKVRSFEFHNIHQWSGIRRVIRGWAEQFCSVPDTEECLCWMVDALESIVPQDSLHGLPSNVFSPEAAMKVFSDKEAIRVVFVRDPLQRVLSAYLDKCLESRPLSWQWWRLPSQLKGASIWRHGEIFEGSFWRNIPWCSLATSVTTLWVVSTCEWIYSCYPFESKYLSWRCKLYSSFCWPRLVNVDSENTSQSFWSRRSHCAGPTMHQQWRPCKELLQPRTGWNSYEDLWRWLQVVGHSTSILDQRDDRRTGTRSCKSTGTMPSKVQERMNLQKQGCKWREAYEHSSQKKTDWLSWAHPQGFWKKISTSMMLSQLPNGLIGIFPRQHQQGFRVI